MRTAIKITALPLLLALAACQNSKTAIESGTLKTNHVDMIRIPFDSAFAPGALKLAPVEQTRLDDFVRQTALDPADEVSIDSGNGPFAAQRAAALRAYFGKIGVAAATRPAVYGDPVPANGLRLVVTRYKVTPPADCPDWSKSSYYDFNNTVHSNFGCANTVNLGAQIADPRDLLDGQTYRPHESGVATLAVDAYHKGTQKTPDKVTTSTDSGGGGN